MHGLSINLGAKGGLHCNAYDLLEYGRLNTTSVIFVLVGTTHTGNIGAAARAMKTMGFSHLRLVDCCPHRTAESLARASGANDIVEQASCHDTLESAIADCHQVYGTSARVRHLSVPLVECREAAADIGDVLEHAESRVAVVFGRERSGLSNDELDRCTRLLHIPVNPDFSSLNLGSAVQVVAYEIAQSLAQKTGSDLKGSDPDVEGKQVADSDAMALFFEHLERALTTTGFLDPRNPRLLMRRLRGYFERNRPTKTELSLLRGMLSASEKPRRRNGSSDEQV
ncbi:MAG: RNA methyltransferase [Gammaproteobacteria bacterium]|nr:RNA methyltransferase [Gammaproteobacteria bacterium]